MIEQVPDELAIYATITDLETHDSSRIPRPYTALAVAGAATLSLFGCANANQVEAVPSPTRTMSQRENQPTIVEIDKLAERMVGFTFDVAESYNNGSGATAGSFERKSKAGEIPNVIQDVIKAETFQQYWTESGHVDANKRFTPYQKKNGEIMPGTEYSTEVTINLNLGELVVDDTQELPIVKYTLQDVSINFANVINEGFMDSAELASESVGPDNEYSNGSILVFAFDETQFFTEKELKNFGTDKESVMKIVRQGTPSLVEVRDNGIEDDLSDNKEIILKDNDFDFTNTEKTAKLQASMTLADEIIKNHVIDVDDANRFMILEGEKMDKMMKED